MLTVCFLLLLFILFFFLGRTYEYLANNKRVLATSWLQYQTHHLYEAMKGNQEKGITLDGFFVNNSYKRIVIYAMGIYYNPLIENINKEYFDKIYLADANNIQLSKKLGQKVYAKEELPELSFDVIVITSVAHFQEIAEELKELGVTKEIVSYSDLVFNASKEVQQI